MADLTQAREEIERNHKAILALTGENERLRAELEGCDEQRAQNDRLRGALMDCAQIADDAIHACVTDGEAGVATTIRNLILSRYPESHKALKGGKP